MTLLRVEQIDHKISGKSGRPIKHQLLHLKCDGIRCTIEFTRRYQTSIFQNPYHFCSRSCTGRTIFARPDVQAKIEVTSSLPNVRAKRSQSQKLAQARPDVRAKISESVKLAKSKPGSRERMSAILKVSQSRPEVKEKLALAMREVLSRPEVKEKISAATKERYRNPEFAAHMSAVHRECNNRPEVLAKMSASVSIGARRAYAEGRAAPLGTFCKIYTLALPSGRIAKVQGTWEAVYAEHLDKIATKFLTQFEGIGSFQYTDESGVSHTYFPDFYLPESNTYVDVKGDSKVWYSTKLPSILKCNPDLHLETVDQERFQELGIRIMRESRLFRKRLDL